MDEDLFDTAHYCRQIGQILPPQAAREHFLCRGDAQGLDPSPYFSTGFYKETYPGWSRKGARSAFGDFLLRAEKGQIRKPHPLIDPAAYAAANPDLTGLAGRAALHFMRHGDAEARSPSAGFDARFYQQTYLPIGQGFPFRHYVTTGRGREFLPKPVPRTAPESRLAMQGALRGLERPFLLVAHTAQASGVPILTLDLARSLRLLGWDPVFLLMRGGPLLDHFLELGPGFITAEGWDVRGLAEGMPPRTPAVTTTSAAAEVSLPLTLAGLRSIVMVHEMADYIREQGLLPALQAARSAGARIIVSMPRTRQTLQDDLGPVDMLVPGVIPPPTGLDAFRRMARWRQSKAGPVFIGAGYADRRKGFDLFLEAARRICDTDPRARFIWLGALDSWAQALADTALQDGLDLLLPGFVAQSLAYYRAADVYLLTSRQDPGPTTTIQAALVGTPFVGYAADIGLIGLAEAAGCFVSPGDVAGFAEAALSAASTLSPARRSQLRHRARAQSDFNRYVAAILQRLDGAEAGAA